MKLKKIMGTIEIKRGQGFETFDFVFYGFNFENVCTRVGKLADLLNPFKGLYRSEDLTPDIKVQFTSYKIAV